MACSYHLSSIYSRIPSHPPSPRPSQQPWPSSPPAGIHSSYYHDRTGLEADIVLHLKDGRYALIECKLGSSEIEDGAKHLIQLRDLIRENNKEEKQVPLREPDLLLVLTGGNLAYTREDGVKVIPLACLKW